MKRLLLFYFISLSSYLVSQINCTFVYRNSPIKLGEKVNLLNDTNWIQIEELKFYIQYSPFFSDESQAGNSVIHLIDLTDSSSFQLPFTEDGIHTNSVFQFAIGIDSTTTMNTQFTGALDPGLGMYWAWNTGYIHFKIEGKSNLSSHRSNDFQLHIGGYEGKNNTQRWIQTNIELINEKPTLLFDFTKFLNETLNLQETPLIMIPGNEAVRIANEFQNLVHR